VFEVPEGLTISQSTKASPIEALNGATDEAILDQQLADLHVKLGIAAQTRIQLTESLQKQLDDLPVIEELLAKAEQIEQALASSDVSRDFALVDEYCRMMRELVEQVSDLDQKQKRPILQEGRIQQLPLGDITAFYAEHLER